MKRLVRHPTWLAPALVFLITLPLYLRTAAPGITWLHFGVDSPELAAAAASLGIPHPPGYPTYVLLGWLFLRLPFQDPACGMTLFSALCAALAASLLAALAARAGSESGPGVSITAGVSVGLSIALSPMLWSQAVIAEVHGLNALFFVYGLWLLWRLASQDSEIGRLEIGLAFLLGLGVGNHLTLMLLLIPITILVLVRWGRAWRRSHMGWFFSALLLGGCVYLFLPLRGRADPELLWGAPWTWDGFWWMLTARPYQGLAFGLPLVEIPRRIAAWSGFLLQGFGWVAVVFGVVGLVFYRSRRRWLDGACLWCLGAYSIFAVGYNTPDSSEYLIPAHLAFTWFIGLGMVGLAREVQRRFSWGWALLPMALVLSVILRLPSLWSDVDASQDRRAIEYAENAMLSAPLDAVLLTQETLDSFPILYQQVALEQRPDLTLVIHPLLQFEWYRQQLQRRNPAMEIPPGPIASDLNAHLQPLSDLWDRPVCHTQVIRDGPGGVAMYCSEWNAPTG